LNDCKILQGNPSQNIYSAVFDLALSTRPGDFGRDRLEACETAGI